MAYRIGRFAGPLDDVKKKLADFDAMAKTYASRVGDLVNLDARIRRFAVDAATLKEGPERNRLLAVAKDIRAKYNALVSTRGPVDIAVRTAQAGVQKIRDVLHALHVPGFGVAPAIPAAVLLTAGALVAATVAMGAWLSHEKTLRQGLDVESKKLDLVAAGLLTQEAISKPAPKDPIGDTVNKLGAGALVIAALVFLGPKLLKGR